MRHYHHDYFIHHPNAQRFLFSTGIECSYPTILVDGREKRIDQLEKCGHYRRWREDLQLVRDLRIHFLRYGVPYYRMHLGPGRYDWSFSDEVLPVMRDHRITPILDLCHFGVPDWLGSFQNPDFPRYFGEFAGAFAQRYPWIWCYTPVNEMYICAEFSGLFGWWNERLRSDQAFVTAMRHLARANVEAMLAIIGVRPDAMFVHCESSEHTHARTPDLQDDAEFYNERRFLSLDLVCGRRVSSGMYAYLRDHGMPESEYLFFLRHQLNEHCIIGHDYYAANERVIVEPGTVERVGEIFGYYMIARQYHERYGLPIMHSETNQPHDGVAWLLRTWANIQQLRRDGVPLCGMNWYSLIHQVDWDVALREENDRVYPVGLFDMDRIITPVGAAYRDLIDQWYDTSLLPNGPLTLVGAWGDPFRDDGGHVRNVRGGSL